MAALALKSLKALILEALAGTTSQKPMDTVSIYVLGEYSQIECDWSQFEAALLELHQSQKVNFCVSTHYPLIPGSKERDSRGVETILWWKVGACLAHLEYGRPGPKAKA